MIGLHRDRRGSKPDRVREKAGARLRRLDTVSVLDWSEQAVNAIHRSLDGLRKDDSDAAALRECRDAVSMLAGAVDVLESRTDTLQG